MTRESSLPLSELQIQLLQDGYSIRVPVQGYSMFPLLFPGDRILIEPTPYTEVKTGQIILFQSGSRLVAHRVLATNMQKNQLLCKGDSNLLPDEPIASGKVLGRVTRYYRKKRTFAATRFSPDMMLLLSRWRYPLFLLKWMYLKMRRFYVH